MQIEKVFLIEKKKPYSNIGYNNSNKNALNKLILIDLREKRTFPFI